MARSAISRVIKPSALGTLALIMLQAGDPFVRLPLMSKACRIGNTVMRCSERELESLQQQLAAERGRVESLEKEVSRLRGLSALSFIKAGDEKASDVQIQAGLEKFWKRMRAEMEPGDSRVFRQNPMTGRWTLYVSDGSAKPRQYSSPEFPKAEEQPQHENRCPFCVGNEHKTPDPLFSIDAEGNLVQGPHLPSGWQARAIPNIFPLIVTPHGAYGSSYARKLAEIPHSSVAEGKQQNAYIGTALHHQMDATGYSEVVVEGGRHNGLLGISDAQQATSSLRLLQSRGRALAQKSEMKQFLFFKQYGPFSGGSLVHPHLQVMALPVLSPEMELQLERACKHHQLSKCCLKCSVLKDEPLGTGPASARLVHESTHFLVVVPFAGRAFHVSIVPRTHRHSWLDIGEDELTDMASVLQITMEALYHLLDDPSYIINIFSLDSEKIIREGPDNLREAFHWGIEIQPRLPSDFGGLEFASGIRVVAGLPEEFARDLRRVFSERLELRNETT